MTVNIQQFPNRIQLTGDVLFSAFFGQVCAVIPMTFKGVGHEPHIKLGFIGGMNLEISPAVAVELARRLPEALASLPREYQHVADNVGGNE